MTRRRRATALAAVALLVLAGCTAPVEETAAEPGALSVDPRPDPATDRQGWERGYWYDERLGVTADDGLNETELNAVVGRAMARVERIRNVEFDREIPVSIVSREEFRSGVTGDAPDASDPSVVFENTAFEALFLVGEREDAVSAQQNNTGSNVLGYYSPGRDEIVIVSDSETPTIAETTLGHELMHAYQFGQFELDFNESTWEQYTVSRSVTEGDAAYVDYRYGERCGANWSCVAPAPPANEGSGSGDAGSGGSAAHVGISILRYFPYSDGPAFVRHVYERGGWDAVDRLYDRPPESSEQVVTPAKYREDAPTTVDVPDRSADTWERLSRDNGLSYDSYGMSGITAMFAYPSYDDSRQGGVVDPRRFLNYRNESALEDLDPINYNVSYAEGWDGDRLVVYRNAARESPHSQTGYVWRLTWDSPGEASEFATGYRDLLRYWGGERVGDASDSAEVWRVADGQFSDAFRLTVEGTNVTITNAPTVEGLDAVHDRPDGR